MIEKQYGIEPSKRFYTIEKNCTIQLNSRVYKKYILNFDATDYVSMVDMNNDDILFEPAFTRQIPYDHLVEYLDFDEPPLADPQIPMHIQGTETCTIINECFKTSYRKESWRSYGSDIRKS